MQEISDLGILENSSLAKNMQGDYEIFSWVQNFNAQKHSYLYMGNFCKLQKK